MSARPLALLPALSLASHKTGVERSAKIFPLAGVQVTVTLRSTSSVPVAVKFTTAGTITVRATLVRDPVQALDARAARQRPLLSAGGSWIALQVADTGVGIAEKDLQRIFEEFEQVDSGARADSVRRGTGLGLTITRRLARLLDGDITVESTPGTGSVFTCWLPVDPAPPVQA